MVANLDVARGADHGKRIDQNVPADLDGGRRHGGEVRVAPDDTLATNFNIARNLDGFLDTAIRSDGDSSLKDCAVVQGGAITDPYVAGYADIAADLYAFADADSRTPHAFDPEGIT
jgi:hypothetical protein